MSEPARKPANDVVDVYPFIHMAAPLSLILAEVAELKTDFDAMEAVEGGPVQTVDVPGAGGDA